MCAETWVVHSVENPCAPAMNSAYSAAVKKSVSSSPACENGRSQPDDHREADVGGDTIVVADATAADEHHRRCSFDAWLTTKIKRRVDSASSSHWHSRRGASNYNNNNNNNNSYSSYNHFGHYSHGDIRFLEAAERDISDAFAGAKEAYGDMGFFSAPDSYARFLQVFVDQASTRRVANRHHHHHHRHRGGERRG